MHEGHGCSWTVEQHWELYRGGLTTSPLPSASPWHLRHAFHFCCSFAIYLMVSVTAPGGRWQWEVQNSLLAPPGSVGGVLYILHVWSYLVYASVSHTYTPEQCEQLRHPTSSPETTFPTIYFRTDLQSAEVPNCKQED